MTSLRYLVQSPDCVACLARQSEEDSETGTVVLLRMLVHEPHTVDDVVNDLCAQHKKRVIETE